MRLAKAMCRHPAAWEYSAVPGQTPAVSFIPAATAMRGVR
ncbi:UNVERIFIED_ORG: hypothetical protein ABIB19_000892 [Arthrobacter sp. UYEF10]